MMSCALIVALLIGAAPGKGAGVPAISTTDVIGYRDMSTKDRIFGSVAGLVWLGSGAYVWQVAAPTYSDATKPKILLFWIACGSGLLLWLIAEKRARKMVFWEFMVWGAGFGLLSGALA
jgi:hypothetical protein